MLTAHDHGRFPATTVEGLEVNTLWDGVFHTGTWIATVAGVGQLWYATTLPNVRWSFLVFAGSVLLGWGGFNLIEGLVDHHLLGIHHVRDDLGGPLAWDLAFLASGVVLVLAGWGLIRVGEPVLASSARCASTRWATASARAIFEGSPPRGASPRRAPFSRLRLETVTRSGMPRRSASLNLTPADSIAVVEEDVEAGLAQLLVERLRLGATPSPRSRPRPTRWTSYGATLRAR